MVGCLHRVLLLVLSDVSLLDKECKSCLLANLAVPIKQKALNSNKKLNITKNLLFSCFIFLFQKIKDFLKKMNILQIKCTRIYDI